MAAIGLVCLALAALLFVGFVLYAVFLLTGWVGLVFVGLVIIGVSFLALS